MKPEGEDGEWRPSVFWIIAEHAFQIVWEQSSTSLHTHRRSQESALIQAITVQREDAKICPDQSGVDLLGFGDGNQRCDPVFLAREFLLVPNYT